MATYRQIQEDISRHHGRTVKTCWIAHVNERPAPAHGTQSNQHTR